MLLPYHVELASPLDAARLRHKRSRECLNEAVRLIREFQETAFGRLTYQEAEGDPWRPLAHPRFAPLEIPLEVSETLYNLKATLDYAMYALLKEALKRRRLPRYKFLKVERRIQFPLKDTPKKFDAWKAREGYWLLIKHAALIERAQPYNRPMMRLLGDDYHNLDKHREVQPLVAEYDLSDLPEVVVIPWEEARRLDAEVRSGPANVGVYRGGSVEVTFEDGSPAVPTLKRLVTDVRTVIDALDSYFK